MARKDGNCGYATSNRGSNPSKPRTYAHPSAPHTRLQVILLSLLRYRDGVRGFLGRDSLLPPSRRKARDAVVPGATKTADPASSSSAAVAFFYLSSFMRDMPLDGEREANGGGRGAKGPEGLHLR